mmetsp:Transcript_15972/g.50151  ORF Transcript_15972/g.50151 Transcript_15972/m.50151 type:complete len:923 (-) Transcript_15972:47-2815(-)
MGATAGTPINTCCRQRPPDDALPLEAKEKHPAIDDGSEFLKPPEESIDAEGLRMLRATLKEAGIDPLAFGRGNAKSLERLYYEIRRGQCSLSIYAGTADEKVVPINSPSDPKLAQGDLRRLISQVHATVVAAVDGIEHVLVWVPRHPNDRKQLLVQTLTTGQDWRAGLDKALEYRLHLGSKERKTFFTVDERSYTHRVVEHSLGEYPGLPTVYRIHSVLVFVDYPMDPALECLGLPDLRSFSRMEGQISPVDGRARLHVWAWEDAASLHRQGILAEVAAEDGASKPVNRYTHSDSQDVFATVPGGRNNNTWQQVIGNMRTMDSHDMMEDLVRRVPLPPHLSLKPNASIGNKCPNAVLARLVADEQHDEEALTRAARRMLEKSYSLRSFFDDCSKAFPELRLYLGPESSQGAVKSQRTPDDEYQRTVGALFALYWLMRLDIDGKDGFCYGVDDQWMVRTPPAVRPPITQKTWAKMSKEDKRELYYTSGPWQEIQELLVHAGLLMRAPNGTAYAMEERLKAMLALTAVHDVMKVEAFIPTVAAEHAPFGSYAKGEEVGDHDMALAYVLEHSPALIPSVRSLPQKLQKAVLFTQSKMDLNYGFLVQSEGPPAISLTAFKRVLQKRGWSGPIVTSQQDVSFYFVHWLTDVAGSVPTPLAGCERLVQHYPRELLRQAVSSFQVLRRLVDQDETTVYEDFLRMRWAEAEMPAQTLSDTPGPEAICRCRLLCMAQHVAPQILEAFNRLQPADRRFLSGELALSGRSGQVFSACGGITKPASGLGGIVSFGGHDEWGAGGEGSSEVGPAFLTYCGPALLQRHGATDPDVALQMLVSILRAGRAIWPSSIEAADETVTLRLDALRELSLEALRGSIHQGEVWLLVWHSECEAFVQRRRMSVLNSFTRSATPFQVLVLLQGGQLSIRKERLV